MPVCSVRVARQFVIKDYRVFVRRSDLKSGSEILTGKFLAYMTQIEARIFRKA